MRGATNPARAIAVRALGLTAVLAAATFLWGATLASATADPHGFGTAAPISAADVPRLEPLYGAVLTPDSTLDWSPDGRWIATGGGFGFTLGVSIFDARNGQVVRTLDVPGYTNSVRWSPDGRELAVGVDTGPFDGPGWVFLYSGEGLLVRSWMAHSRSIGDLAWSPNGSWLATTANVRYAIWDVATGTRLRLDLNASASGDSVSWSPDGRRLAFGSNGGVSIYDVFTGARVAESRAMSGAWTRVAWSHSGDRVAAGASDGCTGVFTADATPLWVRVLTGGPCSSFFGRRPDWSPDDAILALPNGLGILLVDAQSGALLRTLAISVDSYGPPRGVGSYGPGESRDVDVEWSPAGTQLASTASITHPSLRVWGIRRSPIPMWVLGFEVAVAIGMPLVLGREFLALTFRPERGSSTLIRSMGTPGLGTLLLGFAFILAALQASTLDVLERTFDARVVPPSSWFVLSFALSGAVGAVAALASLAVFQRVLSPTRATRPALFAAARTLGLSLIPVVWAFSLGYAAIASLLAAGVSVPALLWSLLIAIAGAAGLLPATLLVSRLTGTTSARALAVLILAALGSILAFLGSVALVVVLLNLLQVRPSGDVAQYGITVALQFGLVPLVTSLAALVIASSALVLVVYPRFLGPLYTRLTRGGVLGLETRRRLLERIETQPGAYFRELLRSLGVGIGNLHYHLGVLEREGLIIARHDGIYRRFFPTPGAHKGPGDAGH